MIAPGWYFDGSTQRWWDGVAWGPAAPDSNDRTLATLAHLGALLGGPILPLIMYLISDDERRPETRYHSREALNFELTLLAAYFLSFIGLFLGLGAGGLLGTSENAAAVGVGVGFGVIVFFASFALIFAVAIGALVFSIMGAVKANNGVRYRYPLCIRFIGS